MKKLAIIVASLAIAAAPVLACPHSSDADDDQAPKTAEKDGKAVKEAKAPAKAKEAKDAKVAKPAEKAKPAKPAEKKTEKVSSK